MISQQLSMISMKVHITGCICIRLPLILSILIGCWHIVTWLSLPFEQVFIQSDVLEVATDMRDYFEGESDQLLHIDKVDPNMLCDTDGWLLNNPMGIRTEREIHAEYEGGRIYRRLYQKKIHVSSWIASSFSAPSSLYKVRNAGKWVPPFQYSAYQKLSLHNFRTFQNQNRIHIPFLFGECST